MIPFTLSLFVAPYFRKYISSFRATRTGKMGNLLDTLGKVFIYFLLILSPNVITEVENSWLYPLWKERMKTYPWLLLYLLPLAEFMWRCILKKQIQMVLAVVMGIMSAAILLAEATLLLSKLDLSLFSILISSVKSDELLVQVRVLCILIQFSLQWSGVTSCYLIVANCFDLPVTSSWILIILLSGICFCTFGVYVRLYILFSFQNWDADDLFLDSSTNKFCESTNDLLVSEYLSIIFSLIKNLHAYRWFIWYLFRMIARYAPPISYNFINLIQLHSETIFEKVFFLYLPLRISSS